jgi:hypothetical protein
VISWMGSIRHGVKAGSRSLLCERDVADGRSKIVESRT